MNQSHAEGAADELRRALQSPIYNRVLRKEVGAGVLDYEVYLRTRALLSLQTASEHLVPDELLFQVMHQTQELWLKSVAYETVDVVSALDADDLISASARLERIIAITRCLGSEIRLLQTVSPEVFLVIRRQLGSGSGLESPGYNQLLLAADVANAAFERALERRAIPIIDLYAGNAQHRGLHRIAEQYVDWDEAFQTWLVAHFMLVRRTLGVDRKVRGLDGFPTAALAPRMTKPLFPALWDARVELAHSWDPSGGVAPGEDRSVRGSGRHEINRKDLDANEQGTGADGEPSPSSVHR